MDREHGFLLLFNQVIELSQQLCQLLLATALIHLIHIFPPCHKASVGFLPLNLFCRSHPLLWDIIKSKFPAFSWEMCKQHFCLWITPVPANSVHVLADVMNLAKIKMVKLGICWRDHLAQKASLSQHRICFRWGIRFFFLIEPVSVLAKISVCCTRSTEVIW